MVRALRPSENTIWLTSAYVLQKLIAFGYFVFLSRAIGPEGVGRYVFVFALIAIASVIADGGFNYTMLREIARVPESVRRLLGSALSTKIVLTLMAAGLVASYLALTETDQVRRTMGFIAILVIASDAFAQLQFSVLRGLQDLRTESRVTVANQLLTAAFGVIAIILGWPLWSLVVALLVGSSVGAFIVFRVLRREKISLRFEWNREVVRWFGRTAPYFFLSGVFTRLYGYADSLILTRLVDVANVGFWGVATKATNALQFIPTALAAAAYPALSGLVRTDRASAQALFVRAFHYLTLVSLPLSGSLMILARPVVQLVYGPEYAAAAPLLALAMIALPFTFWNFLFAATLNATDRQRANTFNLALASCVTIIGNLALAPLWGVRAAAYTMVASNVVLCLANVLIVSRVILIPWRALVRSLFQVGLATLVALIVVIFLSPRGLLIQLAAGLPVGVLLLVAMGAIRREDVLVLWRALRS